MNQFPLSDTERKSCCLLVEDQETMRNYLHNCLSDAFPEMEALPFCNLKDARAWLDRQRLHTSVLDLRFALIDLGLPDGDGLDLVRYLARFQPDVPSIVITIYGDDTHLFGALSAGAFGFILKDDPPVDLTELLGRIERGEPPLSPSIARRLVSHFRGLAEPSPKDATLTSREQETLALIVRGFTVAEAAGKMGLSAQTVAGYVKIIYQKLHISSRAEATREAIRRGLA